MALLKLKDFDPNYHETFGDHDINGFDIYSDLTNEKVGTVTDILVDDEGHFRYLLADLGFWIFGKKVLLPIGRSRIDYNARRVYTLGLTREQAEQLPEFKDNMTADYDYEERVRGIYRPQDIGTAAGAMASQPLNTSFDRNTYNYQQEPSLYNINEQNHQTLRLYEERLIANKTRVKTGDVTVGKHVETETARIAVPIEKERIVIERTTPAEAGIPVSPGEVDFQGGEVARLEIYEEKPDIRKEAFVREEVRVRKEVDQHTVEAQDTIRREELDINKEGHLVKDNM
ncbi:MAG: hypothetical protein NVS2B14_17940 [Chamaesiphon sp.]